MSAPCTLAGGRTRGCGAERSWAAPVADGGGLAVVDRLEVRRCAQVLITAKVQRSEILGPLVAEAARDMPADMAGCLLAFMHAHTAVSDVRADPYEMMNYVARASHVIITQLALHAAEATQTPPEVAVAEVMEALLRVPPDGGTPTRPAAQAILGALSIRDLRLREAVYAGCLDGCASGAHSMIEALLELVWWTIEALDVHTEREYVIDLLLDRAEEIMNGLADSQGCTAEEQVRAAWMDLESGA